MDDLISRQAAIDAINALDDMPNAWLDCAVDAVSALPPAQPDTIVHCNVKANADLIAKILDCDVDGEVFTTTEDDVARRIATIIENELDMRVIERNAQPEDCDTCKHGYFGDEQCNNCCVGYPNHYERRTDD